jgi:hypothetical protein
VGVKYPYRPEKTSSESGDFEEALLGLISPLDGPPSGSSVVDLPGHNVDHSLAWHMEPPRRLMGITGDLGTLITVGPVLIRINRTNKSLEARIGTERIETRVEPDPDHPMRTLLNGFPNPDECLLTVSKATVNESLPVRRHKSCFPDIFEPLQIPLCQMLLRASSGNVSVTCNERLPISKWAG